MPAGWYTDPLSRFPERYWDGVQWTARIRSGASEATDPMSIEFGTETKPLPLIDEDPPTVMGKQRCPSGHPNPPDAQFCRDCGALLGAKATAVLTDAPTVTTARRPTPVPERSRRRMVGAAVVVAVALGALAVGLNLDGEADDRSTARISKSRKSLPTSNLTPDPIDDELPVTGPGAPTNPAGDVNGPTPSGGGGGGGGGRTTPEPATGAQTPAIVTTTTTTTPRPPAVATTTTTTTTSPPRKTRSQGDLTGDGEVRCADLAILQSHYGTTDAVADVNGDGRVNGVDLSILASNWTDERTSC